MTPTTKLSEKHSILNYNVISIRVKWHMFGSILGYPG